ncbi:hypothetical protein KI387_019813, partial [Taxus chinensis]
MGGSLVQIEPVNCDDLKKDVEVWNFLEEKGVTLFMERLSGHSVIMSRSILSSWKRGKVKVGKTIFEISIESIVATTGIPTE